MPKIVKSLNRQLREKSIKTKVESCTYFFGFTWFNNFTEVISNSIYFQIGAFSVLKELVVVLPDCLADHIGSLVSGIEKALNVSYFFNLIFFLFPFLEIHVECLLILTAIHHYFPRIKPLPQI